MPVVTPITLFFAFGTCVDGKSSAPLIRDGDMVVFFEGREPIGFDRMKPKTIWQCRHGAFHHDEIIGKPFGSRVRASKRASERESTAT